MVIFRKRSPHILFIGSFLFVQILFLQSCASLSSGQLAAVKSFTSTGDSLGRLPEAFFEELAQIRAARGLYFSASLVDAENRVDELNSIYKGLVKDLQLAKKANLSWEILFSYKRALKILAGAARWEDTSREFRRSEERRVGKEWRARWSPEH